MTRNRKQQKNLRSLLKIKKREVKIYEGLAEFLPITTGIKKYEMVEWSYYIQETTGVFRRTKDFLYLFSFEWQDGLNFDLWRLKNYIKNNFDLPKGHNFRSLDEFYLDGFNYKYRKKVYNDFKKEKK